MVWLSGYSKTLLSLHSRDSVNCLAMMSAIKWHLVLNYVRSDSMQVGLYFECSGGIIVLLTGSLFDEYGLLWWDPLGKVPLKWTHCLLSTNSNKWEICRCCAAGCYESLSCEFFDRSIWSCVGFCENRWRENSKWTRRISSKEWMMIIMLFMLWPQLMLCTVSSQPFAGRCVFYSCDVVEPFPYALLMCSNALCFNCTDFIFAFWSTHARKFLGNWELFSDWLRGCFKTTDSF